VTGYGIAGVTIAVVAFAVVGWLVWAALSLAALDVRDRARPRPPLVADPADRRAAAVADAYVAGEFGPDELEWRILLALVPPSPDREARTRNWELAQKAAQERMMQPVVGGQGAVVAFPTASIPWSAAPSESPYAHRIAEGPHCRFHDLSSGSGYIGTVCGCGHDMAMHYNGGCNDCDAVRRSQFPRPRMQEIGRPPEAPLPRSARRQSHG
jgi:hypothetical protein